MSTHTRISLIHVAIVIAVAIVVRWQYVQIVPTPILTADSYGYITIGNQIIDHPTLSTIINEFRTPIYPMIVGFMLRQFGSLDGVVLLQQILGIGTVLLVLLILRSLKVSPWVFVCVGIAVAINPLLFQWERFIMTESLAIFMVMLFLYFWIHTYAKPSVIWLIGLTLSGIIMMLVRPATIIIPFIPLLFRMIGRPIREKIQLGICMAIILAVPFLYQMGNIVFHGYRGIQRAADIAQLGNILLSDMDISKGASVPFYFTAVTRYRQLNGVPNPFRLIDTIGSDDIYQSTERMNDLQLFTRLVLQNNIPAFVKQAVYRYPASLFNQSAYLQVIKYIEHLPVEFVALYKYATGINLGIVLIILLVPFACVLYYRSRTRIHEAVIVGSIIIALQTMFHAALIYEEWSRLNAIIIPIATMILAFWITRGIQEIKMLHKNRKLTWKIWQLIFLP